MTSLRDVYQDIRELGAEVLAISGDHVHAHKAWSKMLGGIPYPMLGDWGQAVTKLYGVHNAERFCPIRSVFIVDRDGILRFVNPAMDARDPGSYAQILEELEKLP